MWSSVTRVSLLECIQQPDRPSAHQEVLRDELTCAHKHVFSMWLAGHRLQPLRHFSIGHKTASQLGLILAAVHPEEEGGAEGRGGRWYF